MINIKSDSRKIKPGDIFVALKGISSNGDKYIEGAIENGASKIIVDNDTKYGVETIKVDDTRKYLNNYLKENYNRFLDEMNIIGITGTNGKTTSAYLLYQSLNMLGEKCAYIGTIGFYLDKKICSLPNTSPDVCDLYDMIITAYDMGYRNIVMEVSSQGLAMGRLENIKFNYALFTNLTQDHLDYHGTMENYAKAKQKLFYSLKENGIGIINTDDSYSNYFKIGNFIEYGFNSNNYKIKDYKLGYKTKFTLNINGNDYSFSSNLIGKYNVYNLVCVIAVLNDMNIDINKILGVVNNLISPPGRMDIINYNNGLIIIDYAHTPDAMKNIYDTINEIKEGNVYTVFGCTGDRDRTKRPIMLKLATENSKKVIITSDDLHNEDFNNILNDMLENNINNNYEIIINRGLALKRGLELIEEKDLLLVLGKGHEEFIIVQDKKIPFNDKKEVEKLIEENKVLK